MARIRLHNDDWGYESNCYVCESRNPRGLHVAFFHDSDRALVEADINFDSSYSGAPAYVHGGVLLAVLDEAQAWASIAIAKRWALTTSISTSFARPVHCGVDHHVTADVVSADDQTIGTWAEVIDSRGQLCARSEATFAVLGEAAMERAAGCEST